MDVKELRLGVGMHGLHYLAEGRDNRWALVNRDLNFLYH